MMGCISFTTTTCHLLAESWLFLQAYLEWEGLLPPPGSPGVIDAYTTFLPYVQRWINGSEVIPCLSVSEATKNKYTVRRHNGSL